MKLMKEVSIRKAKNSELARVISITKSAYKISYRKNALVTKSHEPKDIKEQFSQKKFFINVAIINKKIVGAVRYKFVGKNKIYLYKLVVFKKYRDKKPRSIGSRLVDSVETEAGKQGIKKILLDCAREKKLDDYYKKLGYKIDKIVPHLDHHDVYMSKKI